MRLAKCPSHFTHAHGGSFDLITKMLYYLFFVSAVAYLIVEVEGALSQHICRVICTNRFSCLRDHLMLRLIY